MSHPGHVEDYVAVMAELIALHSKYANPRHQEQLARARSVLGTWLDGVRTSPANAHQLQIHHHAISTLLRAVLESIPSAESEALSASIASKTMRAVELAEQIAFRDRSLHSRIAPVADDDPARPRPIFVASSWRSGTTLLMSLLDAHANLTALPETLLLDPFLVTLPEPVSNDLALLHRNRPIIVNAFNFTAPLGVVEQEFYRHFAAFLDAVVSPYVVAHGGKRWVYKETSNIDSLALIDLIFDGRARFLWLVRHGLDVVNSHIERYERRGVQRADVADYAHEWVRRNRALADFCDRVPDRCLRVRYEDLVTAPGPETERIFGFLGEPWDENLFIAMEGALSRLGGDYKMTSSGGKIDASRQHRWKDWPRVYIEQLGAIVNPMLQRAGYDVVALEQ